MADRPAATVRPVDIDAPAQPRHEGQSAMARIARRIGGGSPWARVAALFVLVAGGISYQVANRTPEDDCSPLVVQHVLHQASVGAAEAERLDAVGEHAAATALRALTDINGQPDDVRLCLILSEREQAR